LAKLDRYKVVLVDLDLPDGLGTDLLRRIREDRLAVKTAIYTGLLNGKAIVDASGEQPDAFFQKPDDLDRLLQWVADAMRPPAG
jgi:DNA-binding NtrC family response regulator